MFQVLRQPLVLLSFWWGQIWSFTSLSKPNWDQLSLKGLKLAYYWSKRYVNPTYGNKCPANLLTRWNLTFHLSFKVKLGWTIFNGPNICLLLVLEVWNVKENLGVMCPANLLMRSNLTFDPSFKVKLVSAVVNGPEISLLLVLEVSNVKGTYRKTCPANLLMRLNLTFGPSFKVKLGSSIFKVPKTCL